MIPLLLGLGLALVLLSGWLTESGRLGASAAALFGALVCWALAFPLVWS